MRLRGLAIVMMAVLSTPLRADEATRIVVTGLPITFASPTATDLDAGFVTATTSGTNIASYTASITTGRRTRSVTTRIQCGTPCPATGSATGVSLQWRRVGTTGAWQTLTSTAASIETFSLIDGGPARNTSIEFRMVTGWTTPIGQRSFNVTILMTVSA